MSGSIHLENLTGTVSTTELPLMLAGGAGTGLARRASATASRSRAALPDERMRRAESTRPDRSMVKATDDVPPPPPG